MGINQDISKSKRDPKFYFDACNVRIATTDSDSTASIINDKGNVLVFSLDETQIILGHAIIKNNLILFSTNGTTDKITKVDISNNYTSFELFSGDLGFDINGSIDTEIYYESDDRQKVYWVDGINQLRHINIVHDIGDSEPKYSQADSVLFDAVPEVVFSNVYVDSVNYGGTHTAGMIQYAYNLISKGGSQSAISPVSILYPLNNVNSGGKVNETVGKILNVAIDLVDTRYDIIRLYALKYTSYNNTPTISVIAEESIGGNTTFRYSDDGRIIRNITSEEFLFLGGTAYIPKTITSKYNRLILGGIEELYFDIDTSVYDTRAYRFPTSSTTSYIKNKDAANDNIGFYTGVVKIVPSIGSPYVVPSDHDCISDFTNNLYKYNSTVHGASGTNITVEVVQSALADPRNVLKSGEVYRIGIEFYNKRGQTTPPKWVCDLKVPYGNLNGLYNTLKVTLANTSVLTNNGVVGWRVLRVDRTEQDKTILCQGIVNPMIFQNYTNPQVGPENISLTTSRNLANSNKLKVPSPFMRNLTDLSETGNAAIKIYGMLHGGVIQLRAASDGEDPKGEIFSAQGGADNNRVQNSFQETRLYQLFSPDLIFNTINPIESLKYKIVGSVSNTIQNCAEWGKQLKTSTGIVYNELKRFGVASLYLSSRNGGGFDGLSEFNQNSRIGGVGDTESQNKYQYYRKYVFSDFSTNYNTEYSMLSTPVYVTRGESNIIYNNQPDRYSFSNNLYTIMADRNIKDKDCLGIISVNSIANNNLLFADSGESFLEARLNSSLNTKTNSTGLLEITRTLSNQYGGNTFEARSRNSYLRIGSYMPVTTTTQTIVEAGDTFVGVFSFARILAGDTQIADPKYYVMSEIVDVPVESSIDLKNRSDVSRKGWDSIFHPSFDDYHNYNKVYSQQPIFNSTTATPFTFEAIKYFYNRINATKVKTNGELVDSWTDLLINEEMYLDGRYGNITKLIKCMDDVYAFQEQAVAYIEISPRVQTVATDGNTVELGIGNVLYVYNYLTTTSGSVNPNAIFSSSSAIYYLDIANKTINKVVNKQVIGISDMNGLHSYLYNNIVYADLKYNRNVTGGFDQITNDAYITTPTFTIAFNEFTDSFTSRYDFIPKHYITSFYGLFTTEDRNAIYKHGIGNYGEYYSVTYPSFVTFLFNPEPNNDCVYNNVEFKTEVYNNGVDVPNITMDKIHCWNEYQDTNIRNLIKGNNIFKRYRDWNANIPRPTTSPLHRMRGPWTYCQLSFNNVSNYKLILHDVTLTYDLIQKNF